METAEVSERHPDGRRSCFRIARITRHHQTGRSQGRLGWFELIVIAAHGHDFGAGRNAGPGRRESEPARAADHDDHLVGKASAHKSHRHDTARFSGSLERMGADHTSGAGAPQEAAPFTQTRPLLPGGREAGMEIGCSANYGALVTR